MSSSEVSIGGVTLTDGALQVCPGTTVNLTCSHDSPADLTRWRVTPPLPMDCNTAITHTNNVNGKDACGPFTISMISPRTEPTRRSTLELAVNVSLNGSVVACFAGGSTFDPQAGNFTIPIIGERPVSFPASSPSTFLHCMKLLIHATLNLLFRIRVDQTSFLSHYRPTFSSNC